MSPLETALQDAGGAGAPRERAAQLRELLRAELQRSQRELGLARSGREEPVTVALAAMPDALIAVVPVAAMVRADPAQAPERAWLLVAATIGALIEIARPAPPRSAADLILRAGALDDHLALSVATSGQEDPELAALAFEEHAAPIARLRVRALALPAHVLSAEVVDLRAPLAPAWHSAEAVARLGGRPADAGSVAELEDAVLELLASGPGAPARPHDDPDPGLRVARRILQRLNGMGKWGGYHTDFAHLPRGFAGNERALAEVVGEALIEAGLLDSKPSVGQRHVFLNPRRAADIHALIERGVVPEGLRLP